MYTRSELRYACYRAKKGNATEDLKPLLETVEAKLAVHQKWENFTSVWDILVDGQNEVIVMRPETDYDYVHSTCLEAGILSKRHMNFTSFNDRQHNIINIVESAMLEKLMTWETYGKDWGIEIDPELKLIKTKLYNTVSNQITVTEEMIEASKKEPNFTPIDIPEPLELDVKPMSPDEIDTVKKMFQSKNISTQTKE
jgi:phosphoenolpyruvate synthase/pyruvate phosphate dikinase